MPSSNARTAAQFLLALNKAHISGPRTPQMPRRYLLCSWKIAVPLFLARLWILNMMVMLWIANLQHGSALTTLWPLVPLENLSLVYSTPLPSHTSRALVMLHPPLFQIVLSLKFIARHPPVKIPLRHVLVISRTNSRTRRFSLSLCLYHLLVLRHLCLLALLV